MAGVNCLLLCQVPPFASSSINLQVLDEHPTKAIVCPVAVCFTLRRAACMCMCALCGQLSANFTKLLTATQTRFEFVVLFVTCEGLWLHTCCGYSNICAAVWFHVIYVCFCLAVLCVAMFIFSPHSVALLCTRAVMNPFLVPPSVFHRSKGSRRECAGQPCSMLVETCLLVVICKIGPVIGKLLHYRHIL